MLEKIQSELQKNHPNQKEFHSAVIELAEDVLNEKEILNKTENEILGDLLRLIEPDRLIRFKVEWYNDQNELEVNRGYRVQFNNILGPYKGGLRFHPSVNESILKFLGFEQIFKNSLTDLPMGGAKGGSDFDPKGKSKEEILRFCQAYMTELIKYIGAQRDIPAGDIGVGSREIGFLYGQYLKIQDQYKGALTGKKPDFGGSHIREEATGYGCVYFIEECFKAHNKILEGKTILVSGSGNVALYAVEKLISKGVKVLTVSDSGGTLYFEDGINEKDIEKLKDLKFIRRERLSSWDSENATFLENKKPWKIKADIALPCATQREILEEDAKDLIDQGIECIAEGANMPLTKDAVSLVLSAKDLLFLPAKACNAGGVAVSSLERSQNATHEKMSREEVDKTLQKIMKTIHKNCIELIEKENNVYPYKQGANLFAFRKVTDSLHSLYG